MKILAGSVTQTVETFLHPGYLSASAHSMFYGNGGTEPGLLNEIAGALYVSPWLIPLIGAVVAVALASLIVVRRRVSNGGRVNNWLTASMLIAAVGAVMVSLIAVSVFFLPSTVALGAASH